MSNVNFLNWSYGIQLNKYLKKKPQKIPNQLELYIKIFELKFTNK